MGNKKDTFVIVTVDTCDIEGGNIKVIFSDNRGDMPGLGSQFRSKVSPGKRIYWIGKVMEPGEGCEVKDMEKFYDESSVEVKQIEIKNGEESKVLKKNYYYDVNNNGVVFGKIKKSVEAGTFDEYNITILVNGTIWITIDPQLYMK